MISVIVPYHNSSAFMDDCIRSILSQTYQDFELILVNDHSTDESQLICKNYADTSEKIILVDSDRKGVSSARNTGIDHAKGDYIVFVDSDDWLVKGALEVLKKSIQEVDLVSGSYCKKENIAISDERLYCLKAECLNRKKFVERLFDSKKIYQGYCWGKLFKNEIIKENHIRFDESLAFNEDRLFVLEYVLYSSKVRTINECVYGYRQHSKSVMSKAETDSKMITTKIENEIQSAKKMEIYLADSFPEGKAWLEYNLLKKLYDYRKAFSKSDEIPDEIMKTISKLESRLWKNKYIDWISKIKLIWKKIK